MLIFGKIFRALRDEINIAFLSIVFIDIAMTEYSYDVISSCFYPLNLKTFWYWNLSFILFIFI
jgi:hypothetical protein